VTKTPDTLVRILINAITPADAAGRAPARIRRRLAPRGRHEPRQPHHLFDALLILKAADEAITL